MNTKFHEVKNTEEVLNSLLTDAIGEYCPFCWRKRRFSYSGSMANVAVTLGYLVFISSLLLLIDHARPWSSQAVNQTCQKIMN